MKSNIFSALIILATIIFIYSCDTVTYDEISGGVVANPTYTAQIQTIMQNNCVTCHNASGSMSSVPLTTYQEVKDAFTNSTGLMSRINGTSPDGPMPPEGVMNSISIQNVQNWVNNGMPQ